YGCPYTRFPSVPFRPLRHLTGRSILAAPENFENRKSPADVICANAHRRSLGAELDRSYSGQRPQGLRALASILLLFDQVLALAVVRFVTKLADVRGALLLRPEPRQRRFLRGGR